MRASLVFLVACWQTPPPPAEPIVQPEPVVPMRVTRPPQPTCRSAVEHAFEIARSDLQNSSSLKDRFELLREAIVDSCRAMEWSADTLACFGNAGASDELRECQQKLTGDQSADAYRRMSEVIAKPVP